MGKSETIKNLAAALAKFQGEMEAIHKDASNPFFKTKYASLSAIIEDIRKPLSSNGLAISQFPTGENGLETILTHTSGEWISSLYTMEPVDKRPQSVGSMLTYMRRYALVAILGLQVEDDDGNEASGKREGQKVKYPSKTYIKAPASHDENAEGAVITLDVTPEQQRKEIFELLKKHGVDIKSKKACEEFVATATQLALVPTNYEEIINQLSK